MKAVAKTKIQIIKIDNLHNNQEDLKQGQEAHAQARAKVLVEAVMLLHCSQVFSTCRIGMLKRSFQDEVPERVSNKHQRMKHRTAKRSLNNGDKNSGVSILIYFSIFFTFFSFYQKHVHQDLKIYGTSFETLV